MTCKSNFKELYQKEFDGQSCNIIAAGPSLLEFEKSICNQRHCFIVNSAILFANWDEESIYKRFWVSNDSLCLRWSYWDKVVSSKCNIIVRDSWYKYIDLLPSRVKFFTPRSNNTNLNDEDEGLCYCSSVPTCIDMAIKFNFKNIYIYGLDHDSKHTGYFWESWNSEDKPKHIIDFSKGRNFSTAPVALKQPVDQRLAVWKENVDCFQALNKLAIEKEVSIINMNKNSKIDVFKKVN